MKKELNKRILSALLAMLMTFSCFPAPVYAVAETDTVPAPAVETAPETAEAAPIARPVPVAPAVTPDVPAETPVTVPTGRPVPITPVVKPEVPVVPSDRPVPVTPATEPVETEPTVPETTVATEPPATTVPTEPAVTPEPTIPDDFTEVPTEPIPEPTTPTLPTFSVTGNVFGAVAEDYITYVSGKKAVFLTGYYPMFPITANPAGTNPLHTSTATIALSEIPEGMVFKVTAIYDDGTYIWYQLAALEGSLPGALEANPWVFQNYSGTSDDPNSLIMLPDEPEEEDTVIKDDATGITVNGVPAGSEIEASNVSPAAVSGMGIYSIKVKDSDGNYWQPAPGETVSVSIPAAGADLVSVLHFMEDPEAIRWAVDNDRAAILDCNNVPAEYAGLVAPAIAAYQTAYGTNAQSVVIESFENVPVDNGYATVDALGFSMFIKGEGSTADNPVYVETEENLITALDGQKLYVRPGDWIRLTAGRGLKTDFIFTDGTTKRVLLFFEEYVEINAPSFVTELDRQDGWFHFDESSYYIQIDDDPSIVGQKFQIAYNAYLADGAGLNGKFKVEFEVVPYWEYDKVRICTLPNNYNGYPVELSEFNPGLGYHYYTDAANLSLTNTIYTDTPSTLIDVTALRASDKYLVNTQQTVYGMVDTTGVSTTAFLTDTFTNTIAPDIVAEYCTANGLNPANYHLIVYTIKYEAIGDNVGWYINCKVVPNDTYLLKFDYNFPSGFDQFDIDSGSPVKPGDQIVSSGGSSTVESNEVEIQKITLSAKLKNPNTGGEQDVTAELLGWSTNPSATEAEYKVNTTAKISMTGNTTLYGVWKITKGEWEYPSFTWYIACSLVDAQNRPVDGTGAFTNAIYCDGENNFPTTYTVYDSAGNAVDTQQFTPIEGGFRTYTIPGNHYIVIEGVPTKLAGKHHTYTLEQTSTATGYTLKTAKQTAAMEGSNTINTGTLVTYIVNEQNSYNISYHLDGGVLGDGITNPVTYTVEDAFTLQNPTKEGYNFLGWAGTDVDSTSMSVTIPKGSTGDRSYTATWEVKQHTITWNAGDGKFADNDTVKTTIAAYGSTPAAPEKPTKDSTAQYTYTFDRWSPTISAVTGDATYTAIYSSSINTYTVTWKNEDGTVLETDENVPYGTTPSYDGAQPVKPATAQYTYTFNDWSPAASTVTGNATYTATYTPVLNTYVVTFQDHDGTVLKTQTVDYGSGATAPALSDREGYTFTGWDVDFSNITGDLTVTAQWKMHIVGAIDNGTVVMVDPVTNTELTTTTADGKTAYLASSGEAFPQIVFTPDANYAITAVKVGDSEITEFTLNEHGQYIYNVGTTCTEPLTVTVSTQQLCTVTFQFSTDCFAYEGLENYVQGENNTWTGKVISGKPLGVVLTAKEGYNLSSVTIDDVPLGTDMTSDFTSKVVDSDTTIVVTASPILYNITYDLKGGALATDVANPASYTVESDDITLNNPTREGHTFGGWVLVNIEGNPVTDSEGNPIAPKTTMIIPKGSTGDRKYEARWKLDFTAKIVYQSDGNEISAGTVKFGDQAAVDSPLQMSNVAEGANPGTPVVFKAKAGYKIVAVTVNGVVMDGFTEREYTYIIPNDGITAENNNIVVTTEQVQVIIEIVIGTGDNQQILEVQKYSDVLIAITPSTDNLLTSMMLTDINGATSVDFNPSGYIFTAANLENSVTITIGANTSDVYYAVGVINQGTVELTYNGISVKSTDIDTSNKYLPYNADYTITLTPDEKYSITEVNGNTLGTPADSHTNTTNMSGSNSVTAFATLTKYDITFDPNGGSFASYPDGSQPTDPKNVSYAIGASVTLEEIKVTKDGYTLTGWWYDKNSNSKIDKDEVYKPTDPFTMPGYAVTMKAQWVDARLNPDYKVYLGINMSFYERGSNWYYTYPAEPNVNEGFTAVRIWDDGNGTWDLSSTEFDTHPMPLDPSDYISEAIFGDGYIAIENAPASGRFDKVNGLNGYLSFTDADYTAMINTWLNHTEEVLQSLNATIDWSMISKNAADYVIIPYVIKQQHSTKNVNDWFIDMVVLPKGGITYNLNLSEGYVTTDGQSPIAPTDSRKYGQGFEVLLPAYGNVVKSDNTSDKAIFRGWYLDADNDKTRDPDETLYESGDKFIMPAESVTLTAEWSYPLTINQSDIAESAVYEICRGNKVITRLILAGNASATIVGLDPGKYTVQEITGWTWTYTDVAAVEVDTTKGPATAEFDFQKKYPAPCWLHAGT